MAVLARLHRLILLPVALMPLAMIAVFLLAAQPDAVRLGLQFDLVNVLRGLLLATAGLRLLGVSLLGAAVGVRTGMQQHDPSVASGLAVAQVLGYLVLNSLITGSSHVLLNGLTRNYVSSSFQIVIGGSFLIAIMGLTVLPYVLTCVALVRNRPLGSVQP